jgi:hypothetical protein
MYWCIHNLVTIINNKLWFGQTSKKRPNIKMPVVFSVVQVTFATLQPITTLKRARISIISLYPLYTLENVVTPFMCLNDILLEN